MRSTLYLSLIVVAGIFSLGIQQITGDSSLPSKNMAKTIQKHDHFQTATFAGGCFWCTESDFEKIPGVIDAISGYTGGSEDNPTYKSVSSGATGHLEAVQVIYDPEKVSYLKLLDVFWRHIDPTDPNGQFVDRGAQYRTAIFYHTDEQHRQALHSKRLLASSGRFKKPIATEITASQTFYKAETYHQNYYRKNPVRYKFYRFNSGRDRFIEAHWEELKDVQGSESKNAAYMKPDEETLRKKLTPLQFKVTQLDGTEPPFQNEYWNNKAVGIYVDIVSGEPLFSSKDKFASGTGWPSFTKPLEPENIVEIEDQSLWMVRTELRSKNANSHLGHVFSDGPPPTGLRYCINSASLRFIPLTGLEKEGYKKYLSHFANSEQ